MREGTRSLTPYDQARDVAAFVAKNESIEKILCCPPEIGEIPLDSNQECFGLVGNFCIDHSRVSRANLWTLTVPVIRRLFRAGKLDVFKVVEVRVMESRDGKSCKRLLRVLFSVRDIAGLPALVADDLFRDIWNDQAFDRTWFTNPENIPS
jgi:hypothetical protein